MPIFRIWVSECASETGTLERSQKCSGTLLGRHSLHRRFGRPVVQLYVGSLVSLEIWPRQFRCVFLLQRHFARVLCCVVRCSRAAVCLENAGWEFVREMWANDIHTEASPGVRVAFWHLTGISGGTKNIPNTRAVGAIAGVGLRRFQPPYGIAVLVSILDHPPERSPRNATRPSHCFKAPHVSRDVSSALTRYLFCAVFHVQISRQQRHHQPAGGCVSKPGLAAGTVSVMPALSRVVVLPMLEGACWSDRRAFQYQPVP